MLPNFVAIDEPRDTSFMAAPDRDFLKRAGTVELSSGPYGGSKDVLTALQAEAKPWIGKNAKVKKKLRFKSSKASLAWQRFCPIHACLCDGDESIQQYKWVYKENNMSPFGGTPHHSESRRGSGVVL